MGLYLPLVGGHIRRLVLPFPRVLEAASLHRGNEQSFLPSLPLPERLGSAGSRDTSPLPAEG